LFAANLVWAILFDSKDACVGRGSPRELSLTAQTEVLHEFSKI